MVPRTRTLRLDVVRQLRRHLEALAERFGQACGGGVPGRDHSGFADRVKAQVVGPDGQIKQEVDH